MINYTNKKIKFYKQMLRELDDFAKNQNPLLNIIAEEIKEFQNLYAKLLIIELDFKKYLEEEEKCKN